MEQVVAASVCESMFDLSNPQKRERVLVVVAGFALCVVVMIVLPGQFRELTSLDDRRQKLLTDIENLENHARKKDEIQDRLSEMMDRSLAPSGPSRNPSESGYQNWLMELARSEGIGNLTLQPSSAAGVRDIYNRVVFTLAGEGRLDQIAGFLRRFHSTDYLHIMTNVSPRPSTRAPNIFNVTFRIEVLALARVSTVNVPGVNGAADPITEEEGQMLAVIRERAILSEYVPPVPPALPPPPEPLPPPFEHMPFCIVTAIVMVDGKPQCWISDRTVGRDYRLFEGEEFTTSEGTRVTIKKIEMDAQRIQAAAEGGVYAIRLGKSFADFDPPTYFFTGIVDADGNPWRPESASEPLCVIVHGTEEEFGNDFRIIEIERYLLVAGGAFLMTEVVCTVRSIDPATNRIQIEAAGVIYTIRTDGSFSEFSR